ncbi:hypothetical protein TrCOL_g5255 [Triparma columacea]|uniref:SWIB domain-containing protein n=1 Tax=Triparma columacea TaxID=722753 RepID=A0A9W7L6K1_9STRA|nr:hypothetical protein TrCOL_g5255 [Triparma columacea]
MSGKGLNKIVSLSPQLSRICNTSSASRPQAVKKTWEYIKFHNLQSCPSGDKRIIVSDGLFKEAFGEDRFHMMQLGRLMNSHFK